MSVFDNVPENTIRVRKLIDQTGSGDVDFLRIYNIDLDGTILSTNDVDLAGALYTTTGTVIDGEVVAGGGGGVTDHGALSGLLDDDHTQYLDESRHDALPSDNPHTVTKAQVGLSNVPDVDATDRANHTGTQTASTVSDFDTEVSNNTDVTNNTAKVTFPEAPTDGQQYARQSSAWAVVSGGGGGVTDHGALTGLADDDHTQYLNETRHDALPADNPHSVTKTQVGLSNVPNTDATARANHTGTQTASTISDFAAQVAIDETTTSISITDTVITYNDEDGGVTNLQLNVFGTEAEDFLNTANTNITTATLFAVRTFTTASKPTGRYRVAMIVQFEPNATANNYLFQLRIDGTQIGLEMEEEGKDVGGDQRNLRPLVGYFDHTGPGTFDIELYAARESNTLVLQGVSAEVWRVS